MPAATNTADLLAVTTADFAKLDKLLDTVAPDFALEKDEDGTSIKDVVAHRAHWIELFFGWYEDGLAGKEVFFPAKGYNWGELKAYNAALRERQAGMGWEEAVAALRGGHARLVLFMTAHDDTALYSGPMKGAKSHWTPGRWAEAAGPSHYRSAAKYIRARLKARAA